jgi:putative chitinase
VIRITAQLLDAATGCGAERAERFAPHLQAACDAYAITQTPGRLAAFLAQIGHESGALRYTAEIWGPTDAQRRYEGRRDLGNLQPGDGERFKGRGLIQTTGRANHIAVRDRLRARMADVPDFEAEPEALEAPQWAAWSAADYWGWRGLNALADRDDFVGITRRINGGLNGLADRQRRWERALQAVAVLDDLPAPIESREIPAPQPIPEPPAAPAQESTMPLSPFIAAALPSVIEAIPKLGKLFGSGSDVAERNIQTAELAVQIAQDAIGAKNAQEAVELMRTDPTAQQAAAQAIEARWYELTEAGGGGIEGARKADAAMAAGADKIRDVLKSHSFWIALLLLPLVYLVLLSIIGVIGSATWSDDVRASIAGLIVGTIVGGLMGYYFGQTTSRNRTGAA